ncbi:tyrosine-type recombinase/integrase [Phocaeicola sp.]
MDKKERNAEVIMMPDLASYMQSVMAQLEKDKKRSAVHTYTYTLKSITEFYGGVGKPMPVDEVFTPGKLKEYEEWMKQEGMQKKNETPKGLSLNSISTYMRSLKAVYNRLADEKVLPYNPKLFNDVYTKVESQTKRALAKEQMNALLCTDPKQLPLGMQCALAYFLLMFLFRGMPFIDLAHLRKQDVKGNLIIYNRHKTGRQMTVRIPKEATQLMEEFKNKNPDSIYLFPILDELNKRDEQAKKNSKMKKDKELYLDYQQALRNFNKKLEKLSALLLPGVKLSSYTPRHTWATLAFHAGVSIGIICKALGHSSIKVTETYLKPFENEKVDAANDELIISVSEYDGVKKAG